MADKPRYGVGLIAGKSLIPATVKNRPKYLRGPFIIDDMNFTAASGSDRFYGCPYGTYILSPQGVGPTIQRLYKRRKIHGSDFKTTWNVGTPEDEIGTGYDPAVRRKRRAIQIHCDPAMKSMGCIVMDCDDFASFASIANLKEDLAITISPKGIHGVEFRVTLRSSVDAVS
jgi:hypothetical protein